MRMLRGDLHTHTRASDGSFTTEEIIAAAKAAGLAVVGITDHETVAGWPEGWTGLPKVVRGVEIASVLEDQEFHLLAYFAGEVSVMKSFLDELQEGRRRRFEAMVSRIRDLGIDILPHLEIPGENKSLGRPHVAAALVRAGAADTLTDAFEKYLAEGAPGYVAREKVPPIDVIEAVHADRGLVSLAHPNRVRGDVPWHRFKEWGLDALEVYHPSADPPTVSSLRQIAERYGFAVSGGSDFHHPDGGAIGVPFVPEEALLGFLSALERRRMLP